MSAELHMDFGSFFAGLQKVSLAGGTKEVKKAATLAGMRLLRDSAMEENTVPFLSGDLKDSGGVLVNNTLVFANGADAATGGTTRIERGQVVASVGYNKPYAAYQHEGIRRDGTREVKKYSQPGSGSKFLESKLLGQPERYRDIAGESLGRSLRELLP